MAARTTFDGARISKGVIAVFVALVVALLLGGVSGYLIKALTLPVATATQHFGTPQVYSLSDSATRSNRGGPQTMDGRGPTQATVGETGARHGGQQFP